MAVKLTILGSGTSTGVPLLFCRCAVCRSRNPKDKRLRASAWVQVQGKRGTKSFLIDTATDLREQALRAKISRIDAVLYTHPHADHIHGIDELRSFNFIQKSTIPLWANAWTRQELQERFPYIFRPQAVEGGGIPELVLNDVDASLPTLDIQGVRVVPVSLKHGSKESVGYRFGSVAYITDCSYIPESSLERLKGLSVLVLDALRIDPHPTHFNLEQALQIISQVRPKRAFLTHLGHDFEFRKSRTFLPPGVALAYDGLTVVSRGDL